MKKRRYLTWCGCLLVLASAFADDSALTREWLEKNYFRSIKAEGDRIVVRFKEGGERFYATLDGAEGTVSEYGGVMQIALGQKLKLSSRHSSLEFTPLPKPLDKNGWIISSRFDATSFGGGQVTRYGIVLITGKPESPELRFVEPEKDFDPKLPPTDQTFQKLQTILAATDPLSRHDLVGETANGEVKAPFPTSVSALHFRWEKKGGASPDPLEVRWIAENVRGAEKNHLVATTKSAGDKREGEFSLKRPTAGFPPGQYRVEIWQVGKMIYSEKFEIKGE
jgi:hypothetical protein